MFKASFSFDGRIRRTEYGLSYLIYAGIAGTLDILIYNFPLDKTSANIILLLLYIPLIWFMLAQGTKRCHDRGNSGWFQLIPFYMLWMLFADSDIGINQFGPNPKGIGNVDEIDQIGSDLS